MKNASMDLSIYLKTQIVNRNQSSSLCLDYKINFRLISQQKNQRKNNTFRARKIKVIRLQ
jgi:hypothetical protein